MIRMNAAKPISNANVDAEITKVLVKLNNLSIALGSVYFTPKSSTTRIKALSDYLSNHSTSITSYGYKPHDTNSATRSL